MNLQEAVNKWRVEKALHEHAGAYALDSVMSYLPDEYKRDYRLAMDAQPGLTTDPNSSVPALLTTLIDPEVYRVLFAPNEAATIYGEVRKGTWLDETAMFPIVEHTGEISSYGDFNENGSTGANVNWPQRQAYLFQTIKEYGDRELERAGLSRLSWVSELDQSAALALNKFSNLSYFYGVAGLANYGILNDPGLSASITPALKAWGGTAWVSSNIVKATANEIYTDLQSLFLILVNQTAGNVKMTDELILAMSPQTHVGMTAVNSFNVDVADLLKKNFPKMRIEPGAVQYGALTTANPQGSAAGNIAQMIAPKVEGQKTAYCAFNEKMRAHPILRQLSSYKQKVTGGTWGTVIRNPMAISTMVGL